MDLRANLVVFITTMLLLYQKTPVPGKLVTSVRAHALCKAKNDPWLIFPSSVCVATWGTVKTVLLQGGSFLFSPSLAYLSPHPGCVLSLAEESCHSSHSCGQLREVAIICVILRVLPTPPGGLLHLALRFSFTNPWLRDWHYPPMYAISFVFLKLCFLINL